MGVNSVLLGADSAISIAVSIMFGSPFVMVVLDGELYCRRVYSYSVNNFLNMVGAFNVGQEFVSS